MINAVLPFLGCLAFLTGVAVATLITGTYWYNHNRTSKFAGMLRERFPFLPGPVEDEKPAASNVEQDESPEKRFPKVEVGHFVQRLGSKLQVVMNAILWQQLSTASGGWERSGKKFRIIQFTNRVAAVYTATTDDGTPHWHWMEFKPGRSLTDFFLGTEENPGPGMRFARSEQQDDVFFSLLKKKWQMVCLGQVEFEVPEDSSDGILIGQGTARSILAREDSDTKSEDELDWLFYIDRQKGDGEDTLMVGRRMDLKVEIEDVI